MKRKTAAIVTIAIVATMLGAVTPSHGAPGNDDDANALPGSGFPACEHPYPCGDEWPDDLSGPFLLKEVRYVQVPVPADHSDPGRGMIELEGWIGLPDVPEGVHVPVALHSTPYLGFCPFVPYGFTECATTPDAPSWWTAPADPFAYHTWGLDPVTLIERGIAAAFFSLRGTGNSGGCWNEFGIDEQLDQVAIVDWLEAQSWSNGRVAMGGVSYPGITSWEAAIHSADALKSIVTAGIMSDLYTFNHTPQGALLSLMPPFWAMWETSTSYLGPLGGSADHTAAYAHVVPDRACEDVARFNAGRVLGAVSDERDAAYYDERRLIDRFSDVTASVLLAQGFDDKSTHVYQESAAWGALGDIPKRMIEGQWGHAFPDEGQATLDPTWEQDSWHGLLLGWLDFWLKGVGPFPEGIGSVDHQDTAGTWRRSTAWPPVEAREEVLYLADRDLKVEPGGNSRTFRSIRTIANEFAGAEGSFPWNDWPQLCGWDETFTETGVGVGYLTQPLAEPATIAGNPFASLRLSSDMPGGLVSVHVLELPSDFECSTGFDSSKVHVVAYGAADLRFHGGNMVGQGFPVDTPTAVRVDLWDNADVIEAGHRLAVVVGSAEVSPLGWGSVGVPYSPRITVHADGDAETSHIVLPLIAGTLGGAEPTVGYPPRPFIPTD